MMTNLPSRLCLAFVCLLMPLDCALSQDFESDKKIEACGQANDLNTDIQALLAEYVHTKEDNKNAACLSACMMLDAVPKGLPAVQECHSKSSSAEMKKWADQMRAGAHNFEEMMKAASTELCPLGCPRGLPTFSRTAQGVAARFRLEKIGPISAQDVKQDFIAMLKVFPEQYGWKLDKKPLAQYEEETYKCTYDSGGNWAVLKEKEPDPNRLLIAALSYCLKESQGF